MLDTPDRAALPRIRLGLSTTRLRALAGGRIRP